MIKVKSDDKTLIIDILSRSFDDNQSVNYIVKQDEKRIRRIRSLMDYSFEMCYQFGEVLLSDDRKACALILYPHLKTITLKSIWLDIKLTIQAIGLGGIKKALKREKKIKAKQPNKDMAYLWFVGVDPFYQNKGIGSNLIRMIIQYVNDKNLPIYLETSTLKNIPWYERFGFQVYDELNLGYPLYFLKRNRDK
ncbi:MAG TPA: GNAT family N-acetyltransferase [Bacteroidia bacterium]|jgi:ribosomal protein S18 acetylase RimI-like enzyme|nr:GNAT family N-acetyltransferase [Bacteroidia bacterium]